MYLFAIGFIQKFGEKEAINVREANNQQVRDFTIKIAGDKLVRITLWPEFAAVAVKAGDLVAVEGKFTQSGDNGQFLNISASSIVVTPGATKAGREVVNQPAAATEQAAESVVPAATTDSAPF